MRALLIDDAAGLVWLANAGAIEFHLWTSHLPDLSQPDQLVLDLDPGDEAAFADVLQAALRARDEFDRRGVRAYAKTSGNRGLHLVLPLTPGHTYTDVRAWVKALAEQLATAYPELIAVAHGATHEGRLVTIDYAQNSMGRNTAAPYTVRAVPGALVSTPVTWDEIESGHIRPSDFGMSETLARVREFGDLFSPVLTDGQHLQTVPDR
jgi:bifunctional non-homologous end joining protein LigD